jgi:Protein of unknown function (DUF3551)
MRKIFVMLLSIGAVSATAAAPARAQNYPVCLRVYGPANYSECRYTSIAQCNLSASGRAAQCYVDPFVAAAVEPRQRRHRQRYDSY